MKQTDNLLLKELKLEAERKDVVFRLDFDDTQRRSFPPFTFFAWHDYIDGINSIVSSLASGEINLEQGHIRIKKIKEQYYGCAYHLD